MKQVLNKRGYTLIEIVVVMALIAVTTLFALLPALTNRRSQLEFETRAHEVLGEIKYAQSLARGVIWENTGGSNFSPKAVYAKLYNEDDVLKLEIVGYDRDADPSSPVHKALTFKDLKIDNLRAGAIDKGSGDTLFACFSVPTGFASDYIGSEGSLASKWVYTPAPFNYADLAEHEDVTLTLGDDEFKIDLSLNFSSGDIYIDKGADLK
ncbi:TPA: hypothetical protein DDW69_04560 [candidate division CPR2 bacterium]|uniref:Prepilin-type N-terminal cleavage/methylation domain-containing protein n=1 Tax=candidate division CPR2 bacterium GW2011_GWC1_41_48 TaxID=1618344 RepID=A0A0G0YIE6_UNCC2|nr:MAG: hypothetical protein UT47_C0002G0210 [candidate division CPR2 bacterium GW2011_GWC2_39_35]KKR29068.1 MAG: hypothetical protein UT60_C0007G0013 [candidate division CPR2 bacterium GW2011_GWD2_39_7]KKS09316.1 MAG: hypothetical protein UU65_C0002G0094 [candidate division CPR2 bacterium GW2011_GWC1_41_48]OGB70556.1 MAG: hypothetical protein A2Y26_04415 [candidate division CPR2 bacterium GWD2_39_7]HBG82072.1 hypothetical protein [candidate division CPR2 bacterium]